MAWILGIFEVKKGMGQLLLARITGKKITKHFHIHHLISQNNKEVSIINPISQMRKVRLREPRQLIPGHRLISGRTGTQTQVYSTPIPVFPLPPQIDTIIPSCLSQNKIPVKNLSCAYLTFSSNWEWWLSGQRPEQRTVWAGILEQVKSKNRVETWKIFVEESSEYRVQG